MPEYARSTPKADSLPLAGGRKAALQRLHAIDPVRYAKTRNGLDGDATRLSAYLRHGCLSLAECRDHALQNHKRHQVEKFINELGWRDFYQRVWDHVGDKVWKDLEPWKTGHGPGDYADELPEDILNAETGVDWVDHFARELHETGYLHNHARMWIAAYVVHARRVKWQAGAEWFLEHLLDGDEASNSLSWQWVASTFSHKPYIANRGNVVKYSGDRFDTHAKNDPTDKSYEQLNDDYFTNGEGGDGQNVNWKVDVEPSQQTTSGDVALVWDDALRETNPALEATGGKGVFMWNANGWTDKRKTFVDQCLAELPGVEVVDELPNAKLVTLRSPDPAHKKLVEQHHIAVIDDEPFAAIDGVVDLKRFSRYWNKAKKVV
ncbi:MAG: FAD-binding domain-containing protein [Planctomycetota bacterium]